MAYNSELGEKKVLFLKLLKAICFPRTLRGTTRGHLR